MSYEDKTFVSVIIPVYNVHQYLNKCLESVINQTLKDIEIICVDDCSTDNSYEILNTYAQQDSRIKIIHLDQNQGQGFARNIGIDNSTGDYIAFVDSDDYIDSDYFEKLYNSAKNNESDIAVGSILKHKIHYKKYNVKYKKEKIAQNIQEKIRLCGDKTNRFFYCFNKIYKSELIKTNNIRFSEGQIYEDVMFAIKALHLSNKVVSVPNTNYHYIEHKSSTVKNKNNKDKKLNDYIKSYTELQQYAHENNIDLPEKLNYYTSNWYNPFVKTYIGQYKAKDMLFGFIPIKTKEINYDYPVDLVYLWVDGSDEAWAKKKEYWQTQAGQELDYQAVAKGRFIDNEELKYSLRSVKQFAPWINKIYIVTDNQIPNWLDTNNPKIEVIFHEQFIPKENLPLFNSEAIETYLPYIPNLSEHFLYANDDMLFGNYVNKQFFYDIDDKPIVRLKHQVSKKYIKTSMYTRKILKMQEKINMLCNIPILLAPHHNIDAYKKSSFMECIEQFKDEFKTTGEHKFRTEGDIQRAIVGYYSIATNNGHLKLYSRVDKWLNPLTRSLMQLKKKYCTDSIILNSDTKDLSQKFEKYNPKLFCVNDDESMDNSKREEIKRFLSSKFNEISSYEVGL